MGLSRINISKTERNDNWWPGRKKKKCIQTDTGSQKTEKEENSKQGQMSFVSQ